MGGAGEVGSMVAGRSDSGIRGAQGADLPLRDHGQKTSSPLICKKGDRAETSSHFLLNACGIDA